MSTPSSPLTAWPLTAIEPPSPPASLPSGFSHAPLSASSVTPCPSATTPCATKLPGPSETDCAVSAIVPPSVSGAFRRASACAGRSFTQAPRVEIVTPSSTVSVGVGSASTSCPAVLRAVRIDRARAGRDIRRHLDVGAGERHAAALRRRERVAHRDRLVAKHRQFRHPVFSHHAAVQHEGRFEFAWQGVAEAEAFGQGDCRIRQDDRLVELVVLRVVSVGLQLVLVRRRYIVVTHDPARAARLDAKIRAAARPSPSRRRSWAAHTGRQCRRFRGYRRPCLR